MGGLAAFFVGLAAPAVKRVLAALGIGLVSYAAVSTALNAALAAARAAWAGFGGDALSIVQLAGVGEAASILAGALTARVGLMVLKKFEVLR